MQPANKPLKLFAYVVDHDYGTSPNPSHGTCTLFNCKFRKYENDKKSMIDKVVDFLDDKHTVWVIGMGGAGKETSGRGTMIYAMRVDKHLKLSEYFEDPQYQEKRKVEYHGFLYRPNWIHPYTPTEQDWGRKNNDVLISETFYYFGANAIEVPKKFWVPKDFYDNPCNHSRLQIGRNYTYEYFNENFIKSFTDWIQKDYETGIHGNPCCGSISGCEPSINIRKKGKC